MGFSCDKSQPKNFSLILPQWLADICWHSVQSLFPKVVQGTAVCPNPDHPSAVSPPCFRQNYPSFHSRPSPVLTPGVAGCQHCLPLYLFSWLCTWQWKAQTNTMNICIYAFVCLLTRAFPEETRITVIQDSLEWCELVLLVGTFSLVELPILWLFSPFKTKQKTQFFLQLQPPEQQQGAMLLGKGNCAILMSGACEPCQDGKGTSGTLSFMSNGVGPSKRSFKQRSDCLTVTVPEHSIELCWDIQDYTDTALSFFTSSHKTPSPYSKRTSTQTKEHIPFHLVAFRNSANFATF